MKKFLLITISALMMGCNGCDKQQDTEVPHPAPFANDKPELCEPACNHVKEMKCPEANDLIYQDRPCKMNPECEEGSCVNGFCTETCKEMCVAIIEAGRYLGTECWIKIKECSEIEQVCRR